MIHRAGSLSQKYQMKIRSLRCSYVILLYTSKANHGFRIHVFQKNCASMSTCYRPFFSYLILIRATDIMEQINLMITRRQDSNISYIHNTSTCNVFQIPIVSLVDNHNNITFYAINCWIIVSLEIVFEWLKATLTNLMNRASWKIKYNWIIYFSYVQNIGNNLKYRVWK